MGYSQASSSVQYQLDFKNELDHRLPPGFKFVDSRQCDLKKLGECLWKGFNHEGKGAWADEDKRAEGTEWTPVNTMKTIGCQLAAPHGTRQYDAIIESESGEYVCYSGMWWIPQNKLAYMEPLCTVPEYRKMGLAAAALSRHYQCMKSLGATHMSGGAMDFYRKIGFDIPVRWTFWKKGDV